MTHQKNKKISLGILIVILAAVILMTVFPLIRVSADQKSVEIKIPVFATGADCNPALFDEDGNLLQTVFVPEDGTAALTFQEKETGIKIYKVCLTDEDTDLIIYDRTQYTVNVETVRLENGDLTFFITADPLAVEGEDGKPEQLIFNNERITPTPYADPGVRKVIKGIPQKQSTFTFEMKADKPDNPMPEGSINGSKLTYITGEGEYEFGKIYFTEAGIYEYTITEKKGNAAGYIYDETVYRIRYEVEETSKGLVVHPEVFKDGKPTDDNLKVTFVNTYKNDEPETTSHIEPETTTPAEPETTTRPLDPDKDRKTPSGDTPKTDDTNMFSVWFLLMIGSTVFLILSGISYYINKKTFK